MKRILAVDDYLIETVQSVYLWLWDWTGVYLASLVFVLWSGQVLVHDEGLNWYGAIFIALWGILNGRNYLLQDKKKYGILNAQARNFRSSWLRPLWLGLCITDIVQYTLQKSMVDLLRTIVVTVVIYLMCTQLRDREPKEFFGREPATQGGGA